MQTRLNRLSKRDSSASIGRPFGSDGGPNPVEAGRRGGLASGETRRNRRRTALESKVLEARNGAAALALLQQIDRQQRDQLVEREHDVARREKELADNAILARELAAIVEEDMQERDRLRQERDGLYEAIEELEQGKATLEQDLADLRATIAAEAAEAGLTLVVDEVPEVPDAA